MRTKHRVGRTKSGVKSHEIASKAPSLGISSERHALPFAVSALVLIAGCTVGPNFEKPAAPIVSDYQAAPLPSTTGSADTAAGEAQRFVKGMDVVQDWWTMF